MTDRERIIRNYVDGYNQFDINKMVSDFDEDITFTNIQNGTPNMSLIGLPAFIQQAELATTHFAYRTQKVNSFKHSDESTEIDIDYTAILGMDFPNGLKKGEELNLSGKSVFSFKNNKIIGLTDIS